MKDRIRLFLQTSDDVWDDIVRHGPSSDEVYAYRSTLEHHDFRTEDAKELERVIQSWQLFVDSLIDRRTRAPSYVKIF